MTDEDRVKLSKLLGLAQNVFMQMRLQVMQQQQKVDDLLRQVRSVLEPLPGEMLGPYAVFPLDADGVRFDVRRWTIDKWVGTGFIGDHGGAQVEMRRLANAEMAPK